MNENNRKEIVTATSQGNEQEVFGGFDNESEQRHDTNCKYKYI